jgi:predicted secreted protein
MGQAGMKELSSQPLELRLKVGEKHRMRLEGLGSAGYDWNLELEGPEDVIRWLLEPAGEAPAPAAAPGGLPPDNTSPGKMLIITALRPGQTKLILTSRRPWEKETPHREEICLHLHVST